MSNGLQIGLEYITTVVVVSEPGSVAISRRLNVFDFTLPSSSILV